MEALQIKTEEFSILPTIVFKLGDIPVSSSMLTGALTTLLLILFILICGRFKKGTNPKVGKIQSMLESFYSAGLNLVTSITGDEKIAKKILPIILSIVIYIGISNSLLILPIFSSLTYEGSYIFSTNTKDINATFGIAATIILWTQFASIKQFNLWNHFNKFIRIKALYAGIKKGPGGFLMAIIEFLLGLLDIISEIAKSFSLSLRLFGNVFAGELLIALLASVLAVALPAPLLLYSLFTGTVQALVFAALTASYFGSALRE